MNKFLSYTGGNAETNAYFLPCDNGSYLCFDAPEGTLDFVREQNIQLSALLLTHGHYDHVWDSGLIEKEFNCPVYAHQLDHEMILHPTYLKRFGIMDTYPVPKKLLSLDVPLKGQLEQSFQNHHFTLFHVPGHCPGSVAFYLPAKKSVWGGDVLFAGGVGRWDFPGGGRAELLESIRTKFLTLPDETVVYPGHGPANTIKMERSSNPYL